jgi:hypothetical protein
VVNNSYSLINANFRHGIHFLCSAVLFPRAMQTKRGGLMAEWGGPRAIVGTYDASTGVLS